MRHVNTNILVAGRVRVLFHELYWLTKIHTKTRHRFVKDGCITHSQKCKKKQKKLIVYNDVQLTFSTLGRSNASTGPAIGTVPTGHV